MPFSFSPYVKPYVGGLSKEIGESVSNLKNQYYQNAEQDDVLSYQMDMLKNQILPIDHLYADQLLDTHRAALAERAKKGDYENMFRTVRKSARDFNAAITPLMQRAQQRAEYQKALQENKNIGQETKQAALQHSDQINKPYNPQEGNNSYVGFHPSDDQNASDILKDYFGTHFQGDKYVNEVIDPISGQKIKVTRESSEAPVKDSSGRYLHYSDATGEFNYNNEGRKVTQIELAGRQYLSGHKKFKDYAQTQARLGRTGEVQNEMNNAIGAEVQRLGYNIDQTERDTLSPEWMKFWEQKAEENKPFDTAAEVPSENIHTLNKFNEFRFSPTGKLTRNTEMMQANPDGTYTKFYDKEGNQLSVAQAQAIGEKVLGSRSINNEDFEKATSIQRVKASPEEQSKLDTQHNEEFDNMLKQEYLLRRGYLNASPEQQRAILSANSNDWNSKQNREKVYNAYNDAVKQFKTVETELWTKKNFAGTKEISDLNVPTGKLGADVLSKNLLGRTIIPLSNDPETGIKKGSTEGVDSFDAIVKKFEDEGYYFKGATSNGLLKINPVGNTPAQSVTLEFKDDKGQKTKRINVAVGIGASDKKPALNLLQKVGQAYLSGNGGNIPMGVGKAGFKVINIPGFLIGDSKPFVGLVQEIDTNGNVVSTEPIQDWQDRFINLPAVKEEANSFLINK